MRRIIGQLRRARAAFTLMEVNLAVFIMAVGVLAMASLYPLGFRESQQSRDDVRAAIVADEVLGKLTAALSSRNIEWKKWRDEIESAVARSNEGGAGAGWFSYYTSRGSNSYAVKSRSDVNSHAKAVFDALAGAVSGATQKPSWSPDSKYAHGIVVQWGKRIVATGPGESTALNDYSRVSISFRLARRSGALMAAPIYYTEVHFQGDQKDMAQ
jgi:Tfp pilus assembly protein PilV